MRLKKKISAGMNWLGSRLDARGAVLLYHRVDSKENDPFNLCVTPENFDQQMACLSASGNALAMSDFMERQRSGNLDPGSVCVTFDDGYLDVFEKALPILEKHNIPATVFVTTGNLGTAFWWDRLAEIVHQPSELPARISQGLGLEHTIELQGRSRNEVFDQLYLVLRRVEAEERERMFDSLETQFGHESTGLTSRAATVEELRHAAKHPLITIGAHTVTHSRLSALPYRSQLNEMEASIGRLTEITGQTVNSLSYPFGLRGRDYNEDTLRAAAAAGIDFGFTADLNAVTHHTDPFTIPRLWVHDCPDSAFRRQITFWLGTSLSHLVSLPS